MTEQKLNRSGYQRFVQIGAMVTVIGLTLFIAAGRFDWTNAWAYLGLYAGSIVLGGAWMVRKHPEVINERGRADPNTKSFDRIIAPFYLLAGVAQFVVAGLDARWGWSNVPFWLQAAGGTGLVLSMLGVYWAMANNPFLATTVRIQNERGHRVATTGPYRFVRHPMYADTLYFFWSGPLLLNSWWAFIPAVLGVVILLIRTALEDRTLQAELPGYREYAQQVKYRLIPGVW
ncbi:MAG: methyltransferase family protein [Chloroflexota bacterium]